MVQPTTEEPGSYTLKTAQETAERRRLDEVHLAFKEYLGDKVGLAPIYGTRPTRILELGCGSGAWAIQAATDFPDAQILAVDLAPLVAITLPKNMDFQVVDVTQTLPFEEKAFDIVHARLLLMHVPNGKDVLERAAKLVKPGGWLMVEDFDIRSLIENSGPVVSRVIDTWNGILRARGADGEIGRKMKIIIHDTGMYSQPETCMIPIPICKKDKAPPKNLMRLGAVFNMTVKKLVDDWAERFSAEGISQESAEEYKKEIETDFEDVTVNMHFVWAQRL